MTKSETGQMIVKPSAEGLAASVQAAGRKGPPPVHLWNPPFCGELDIRIARDGTWLYLGSPIDRIPMVKLFSSILRAEDGRYVLVTPVEKVGIQVDDLPLHATDFTATGTGRDQMLTFTTRTDDTATAGPDNPLLIPRDASTGEPAPQVLIRPGLSARIDRKSFYRLADLGTHEPLDGSSWFGVWSSGVFFPMIPSNELL